MVQTDFEKSALYSLVKGGNMPVPAALSPAFAAFSLPLPHAVVGQLEPSPAAADAVQPLPPQGAGYVLPTISPIWTVLSAASAGASAFHGYRRNDSVGWALWWGLMGGLFPIVTPAIALAQGFGKPA